MKNLWKIAAGVLGLGLTAAVAINTVMTVKMYHNFVKQNAAELQDGQLTTENDVTIGYDYVILDTSEISDAYRSGDTKNLNEQQTETLQMAKTVIDEVITNSMSDYEKELAIYDWMVENIHHSSGSVIAIPTRGQSVDQPYGVLKNRQAVCVGYATTFRLFMQMLGIDTKVVHDQDNIHSWNMVKLDGEWYMTDIYTDADGAKYFNFNVSQNEFSQRQQWDTEFFPAAEGMKYNYAVMNAQDLPDVYQLPVLLKEMIESGKTGAVFYRVEGDAQSENAQKTSYIIEKVTEYAYSLYDTDGNLYLYNAAIPVNDNETVFGVYVNTLSQGIGSSLPEEERMNLDLMIDEVFGFSGM